MEQRATAFPSSPAASTAEPAPPSTGARSIAEPLLVATRPLRRVEYDRLVDLGFLVDEKIELLNGVLTQRSPQGNPHAIVVMNLTEILVLGLAGRARVRVQLPLAASEISEPEPDIAVVRLDRPKGQHPSDAQLVIEVADSSLRLDRGLKAAIYAAAGVTEYWIVDVNHQTVTVHLGPERDHWTQILQHPATATIAPRAFPDLPIAIAALFVD